jgi:TPR repeat protein
MTRLTAFLALALLLALPARAARADYDTGERAYNHKEWIVAIANLRPIAETDDRAAYLLGKMYLDGNGVISDPERAMQLYRIAAGKGNTDAMISIGAIFESGMGYPRDLKLANAWFRRAAVAGSQYAAFLYGMAMFQGDPMGGSGLKGNPAEAYKWFRIAASTGNYPKVKEAAVSAAAAASNRLREIEVKRIEQEVAAWKPVDPFSMGPLPADVKANPH